MLLIAATALASPPSFVLILADDVGAADLSVYGHPTIRTPRLDQLAREGALFTQAYSAAPICTPSRASFHTGRLSVRNGVYNNLTEARDAWERKDGLGGLPASEATLASRLKALHYDTQLLGKWHLGAARKEFLPLAHGFDHWYGTPSTHDHIPALFNVSGAGPPLYRPCTTVMRDHDVVGRLTNGGMPPEQQTQCNQSAAGSLAMPVDELIPQYTAEATAFIKRHGAEGSAPFLLVYCPDNTHKPTYASAKFRGTSRRGAYGDAVEELDASVGTILDSLKAHPGLDASTLVAFTSDNGAQGGIPGLPLGSGGMLRCMKGTTWEGGIREPLIVRYPGVIPPDSRRLQPVSLMDLYATAVRAAGLPAAEGGAKIDGKDLSAVFASADAPSPHTALFFWRGNAVMAVRVGPFKVHFLTQGGTSYTDPPLTSHEDAPLVFNLEEDPGEGYSLDAAVDEAAAAAVREARRARDAHLRDVAPLAAPQLNMCDPAAFPWPDDGPKPRSHPYQCFYVG